MKINSNLNKIDISVIRKISEKCKKYIQKGEEIINVTIGEPDLEIPKNIKNGMIKAINELKLGYSQLGGNQDLRKLIVEYYKKKYTEKVEEDEIIITSGSTEALSSTIKTLISKGDEVLIPLPFYPGYKPLITMAEGKIKIIDTYKDGFKLKAKEIINNISSKTKAIIITSPSNPTGLIVEKSEIEKILNIVEKKGIYLIADEVYSEIVFHKNFNSFLKEKYKKNVVVINGFSKSHSMTGMRIGYLITNKELRNNILKVHQYTVTSPCTLSQYGAIIALKENCKLEERKKIYEDRAKAVEKKLEELNIEYIKPDGGIYIFISLEKYGIKNSYNFALDILKKKYIAVVPGIAFGVEGYIRISLIKDKKDLLEVIERISDYLKGEKNGEKNKNNNS